MRLSVVVAASAVFLTVVPLTPATAYAEVVVPDPIVVALPNATDVVADEQTQLVFVSTGGNDSVEVLDWSGNPVDSLTGIDNASALTLDAATGTVYAAESANSKIATIDTTTLAVTHYSVSATQCPTSLSVMGGLVYYGYSGNSCNGSGGIGVLDPDAVAPAGATLVANGAYSPLIGAANGTIVMAEAGISPTNPLSYSVTAQGATQTAYRWNTGSNAQDVAMSPDGEEVIVASGAPYEHQAFDPLTLQTLYTYQSSAYPTAAAYSADGSLVATGTASSTNDVRLYNRGQTVPLKSWNLDVAAMDASLIAGGLAFGGKTRLFAIAKDYPSSYHLTIIEFDVRSSSSITVEASSGASVGDNVQVTGELFGSGFGATTALEGEEVTITRRLDGVTTDVGTAVVDEFGAFEVSDLVTAGGTHKYTATWPGNSTYVPATASTTTEVAYLPTSLGITLDADTYLAGSDATVTVTLGHDDQRTGSVTLSAVDYRGTHPLATGSFDATGTFQTTVPLTRSGYLVAEYTGSDTHVAASTDSAEFGIKAAVTTAVAGYFRHSGGVWLFRPDVNPKMTWTVEPGPIATDCAETVLQVNTSNGWRTQRRSGCRDADQRHTLSWTLRGDRTEGTQWRVRLLSDESPNHLPIRSDWTYITFRDLPSRAA